MTEVTAAKDSEIPAGAKALPRPTSLSEVKGWFDNLDQVLFDWLLKRQQHLGTGGDLLEMGCYMGRSAAFLGSYVQSGETFTVCDLFDSPAPDEDNRGEMLRSYSTLTRRSFEANYLAFHDELPVIVQAPTSELVGRFKPGSHRFVHVDASHLYEHVHGDIAVARDALSPQGVVALDDYRAEHTPGVAAATWGAVLNGGLRPICVSGRKFYGTWGDPGPVQEELAEWLTGRPGAWFETQTIAGHRALRISGKKLAAAPQPVSKYAGEVVAAAMLTALRPAAVSGPAGRPQRSLTRRVAREVLPPFIARRLAAALRKKR